MILVGVILCRLEMISDLSDNRAYQSLQEWTMPGAIGAGLAGKSNMTYIERISI